jgi:UPI00017B43E1 related cluster
MEHQILVDFKRLMGKCISMVQNVNDNNRWRLEMFVADLEESLIDIKNLNIVPPDQDELAEYVRRLKFLKGAIHVDKMKTCSQKLMATQILSPISSSSGTSKIGHQTKEIRLQSQAKLVQAIRDELLGIHDDDGKSSLIRKRMSSSLNESSDIEAVYSHHLSLQEKAAQDMIKFTQNLKENCVMANTMIKQDTGTFETASRLADNNFNNLRSNNDQITEFVKRSCQYWLWIMLGLVSLTFLCMLIFIRIFTKKSWTE